MTSIMKAASFGLFALASLSAAHATPATSSPYMTGTYTVSVIEGFTDGNPFSTLPISRNNNPFEAFPITASFTYTGALDFDNTAAQNSGATGDLNSTFGFTASNISHYNGSGQLITGPWYNPTTIANFNTTSTFLSSSGSAANYAYGSLYTIDLGTLAKGTILDITHDDGISIFQGNTQVGQTVSGPTSAVTDQVELSRSGDTILYYSRQNGTPSILEVDVPEPVSLTLLGTGLIGLGTIGRRRRSTAAKSC